MARAEHSHSYLAMAKRARGTSVNEYTLLATDYLNCFNEICMMMELIPSMPECLEDCLAWQLLTYEEHFRRSHIADAQLALEAYAISPPEYRLALEKAAANLENLIGATLARVDKIQKEGRFSDAEETCLMGVTALKDRIGTISALINGQCKSQDEVDQLLARI
ncbi:MAG TPA: hypothetical protein VHL08_00870 [Dongiaceae bacterium]|jgi:hypothetical protein|nr:hypothetical protein [Dongiaceae bacterium]